MWSRNRGTRNLPYTEYLRRRDSRKCYKCSLAFGPGHQCPEKNLRVVILGEDEQIEYIGLIEKIEQVEAVEEEGNEEQEVGCQWMDLSLCSAEGLTQPQTMKLRGIVQGQKVLILIDSGASHNFISGKLVQKLGLKVEPTEPY